MPYIVSYDENLRKLEVLLNVISYSQRKIDTSIVTVDDYTKWYVSVHTFWQRFHPLKAFYHCGGKLNITLTIKWHLTGWIHSFSNHLTFLSKNDTLIVHREHWNMNKLWPINNLSEINLDFYNEIYFTETTVQFP